MPVTPQELKQLANLTDVLLDDVLFHNACKEIDRKLREVAILFTIDVRVHFAIATTQEIKPQLEDRIKRAYLAAGWKDLHVVDRGKFEKQYITTWWISA